MSRVYFVRFFARFLLKKVFIYVNFCYNLFSRKALNGFIAKIITNKNKGESKQAERKKKK
ncbi:hypothetical protein EFR65_02735 [Lactobacillus delbrueckii subsp. lactis]|uniref:Uncharacterized protein n=1 Tax=Lactobacillus delbrueckii subsp. lactis TaxID=29397 RepID=A0A3G6K817_LACDL|nr:MAG: hypothetical protein DQL93_02450 [Lactobacillus delbrueckii subsp. lactis]AZA25841.1 MAG: hypothetical protein DF199_09130 [Lactobacillus delbrueckii subsp. lactis]MCT3503450.1 hypothetical protein [Lactobacillus delbrueckii subsp. lactis]MCT3523151.1 hypothetical protein [Lactobacillus delbrueckii subsp. lactis]